MADVFASRVRPEPDPDLIEYVLVTGASVEELAGVVPEVVALVEATVIRVLDIAVISRRTDEVAVTVREVTDCDVLVDLVPLVDHRLLLSDHDVEMAATVLEPGVAALLLLVEDRWAQGLSLASRDAGGRVSGGERVTRHRFLRATTAVPVRSRYGGLLIRPPTTPDPVRTDLAIDQPAQLRELVELVRLGVISFDQYEDHRRRALEG